MTLTAKKLPIDDIKDDVIVALNQHQTLLLTAPPGAGKSTCLPLWLLDLPCLSGQKIYLLQPRRLAAKNIACYLSQQLGESVGNTVGYRLRNESKTSKNTRLEVITEGILTQIIQHDAELSACGLVVFDEFHERSLNADLAFALTRDIQQGLREDLKILLMSATLATEAINHQLPDAVALESKGRSFPVDINYQAPSNTRLWRQHALSVLKSLVNSHQGSILMFLPGTGDIRYLAEQLSPFMPANMTLCPLYGELSLQQQQQVIAPAPSGHHKLVLATNIAETSLTIEGVDLVIDSGLENVAIYDVQTLSNKLQQRSIAKSSAIQRAGRAGRLQAGHCIRLYSKDDFERRSEQSGSEIQQADLLPMLMEVARWGANACAQLPMIEMPNAKKEQLAWQELTDLGLVSKQHQLTAEGKLAAIFPCHPRFAKMLLAAAQFEHSQQVEHLLTLACLYTALLEERDIFSVEQRVNNCDITQRIIQLFQQAKRPQHQRIIQQAQRLYRVANQQRIHFSNTNNATATKRFCHEPTQLPLQCSGLLLLLAYPERLAKQRDHQGNYLTAYGKGVVMSDSDALADKKYLVAVQFFQRQQALTIALASEVSLSQALAWQVVSVKNKTHLHFDSKQNRIRSSNQQVIGSLVISEENTTQKLAAELLIACWCQQIRKRGLSWLKFDDHTQQLLLRWRWLNQTQTHLAFEDVSEAHLLNTLEQWLGPYLADITSKAQLDKLNLAELLLTQLSYQQQQVFNQLAPSYFTGPTGRKCKIRYSLEQAPIVSLPMQELYGVSTTPSVGDSQHNSQVALIIELLSPAQRPIQITQNLAAFWQGSYREVQKDMRSKYPKHFWPDDPANAQATRKVKKHL
ncbi:ATP-dependent helicase HrpB [Colwellia sp. BRX10-3]|uniref:ATP-dependent helicase HrpB n=1 Tax=Colwellia sp. BRX10-3 TaxID=2759844 RepID=UPI0015F5DE0C|nr:ATP-dependent helicase HrpB [Colwellia sp. BRX10-3]MBA6392359.1 ATP-dependent helicase HrpB [Colwellia sp. BRX10-3]